MRPFALLALGILTTISLSGCADVFGGDSAEPRTHEFTLEIAPDVQNIPLYTMNDGISQMMVAAIGFSVPGQDELRVPNPEIRVKEGDTVILTIINNHAMGHTLHLHGGLIPWEMDGVPFLNQMPIHTGEQFTYTFKDLKAGSYFYHCHVDVAHHMDLGMYGAFIVEERDPKITFDREYVMMLDEWDNCHVHSNFDPVTNSEQTGEFSNRADCLERFLQDNFAQNQLVSLALQNPALDPARDPACDNLEQIATDDLPPETQEQLDRATRQLNCEGGHSSVPPQQDPRTWYPMTFPVYSPIYNTFLINGKAFPDTTPLVGAEGERIKIRFINAGEELHSMHIHGHYYTVTHRDGFELPQPFRADTLSIAPGERYDVIVELDNPGYWPLHDHIGLNVMNDDHAPGGMFTLLTYDDFHGRDADAYERSIEAQYAAMEILEEMGQHGHDHFQTSFQPMR